MGIYIAEEWLALERNVLGKRPLINGSVAEVRAAYAETSEHLASLYPLPSAYDVRDGTYILSLKTCSSPFSPHVVEWHLLILFISFGAIADMPDSSSRDEHSINAVRRQKDREMTESGIAIRIYTPITPKNPVISNTGFPVCIL